MNKCKGAVGKQLYVGNRETPSLFLYATNNNQLN